MQETVPNPRIQQPTVPNRTVRPRQTPPPVPEPRQPARRRTNWLLLAFLGAFGLLGSACLALTVGLVIVFSSGVLPGVTVAGVAVGGLSQQSAAVRIESAWETVTLRDGERTWTMERDALVIHVDAAETAQRAYAQGRGEGGLLASVFGRVEVAPVVVVDTVVLRARLDVLAEDVNIPALDAGVRLVDGQVQATPAEAGKALDVDATIRAMTLDNGVIDLMMNPVAPRVTDASPMVSAVSALLANPLEVRVYDPATGDSVYWQRLPEVWANWLTATPDADSPVGLRLSLDANAVRDFLTAESAVFDPVRHLRLDEAVGTIQDAIAQGGTSAMLRVYHHPRQHTVQAGETITSIAWDYGVPYPWVQQANPGLTTLTIGQTITIPSVDDFLPYDPVPDKRIVVDISEQRTRVYEAGQLKWDWPASTGIADSPTWTGVYQIISHEPNAYAGNWNLWMPNFMGVYQPVPGADFTNGFHGFPTRGGGQLLWENSLGTRVTYGCILLSDINVRLLYDWAEQGVVVEIRA